MFWFPDRPADTFRNASESGVLDLAGHETSFKFGVLGSHSGVFRFHRSPFTPGISPNAVESVHFDHPYALMNQ